MEVEEAGEVPGVSMDFRLVDEGLKLKDEVVVAGVTGAEVRLEEAKEVSLRASS